MHQRQPRMQYPIAISRPKKMIQIRLTRKEKPPPPYTTSFPNGKKARLANFEALQANGYADDGDAPKTAGQYPGKPADQSSK